MEMEMEVGLDRRTQQTRCQTESDRQSQLLSCGNSDAYTAHLRESQVGHSLCFVQSLAKGPPEEGHEDSSRPAGALLAASGHVDPVKATSVSATGK